MNDHTLWEKVCSYQNLRLAWTKVKEKRGGPGVDHMTLDEFEQNLGVHLNTLGLRYFMWVDVVKWLPNNPKSEEKGGLI